jgi:hypothetical protein
MAGGGGFGSIDLGDQPSRLIDHRIRRDIASLNDVSLAID